MGRLVRLKNSVEATLNGIDSDPNKAIEKLLARNSPSAKPSNEQLERINKRLTELEEFIAEKSGGSY